MTIGIFGLLLFYLGWRGIWIGVENAAPKLVYDGIAMLIAGSMVFVIWLTMGGKG